METTLAPIAEAKAAAVTFASMPASSAGAGALPQTTAQLSSTPMEPAKAAPPPSARGRCSSSRRALLASHVAPVAMSAMLTTLTEAVGGRLSSAAALPATDERKPGSAATDEGSRAPAELLTETVKMMRTSGVLVAEGVGVADDVTEPV